MNRYAETIAMLADTAARDLRALAHPGAGVLLKRYAKRLLGRSYSGERDPFFWPAGMLLLGLTECAPVKEAERATAGETERAARNAPAEDVFVQGKQPVTGNGGASSGELTQTGQRSLEAAEEYLRPLLAGKALRFPFADDALAGCALLTLYARRGEERYLLAADRLYETLAAAPKDAEGSLIYHPRYDRKKGELSNDYVFADGAGMSAMFLARYALTRHNDDAMACAITQILNFLQYGFDGASGLNYHGYSLTEGSKKGLVGWGRAVGFLLMGFTEVLIALKADADRAAGETTASGHHFSVTDLTHARLQKSYTDYLVKVLRSRMVPAAVYGADAETIAGSANLPGTGYAWALPAREGHIDTSATAMILYALRGAFENGLLAGANPDAMQETISSFAGVLLRHIDESGAVTDTLSPCEDFGVHRQVYGHYPYGQGAVLAALGMRIRAAV